MANRKSNVAKQGVSKVKKRPSRNGSQSKPSERAATAIKSSLSRPQVSMSTLRPVLAGLVVSIALLLAGVWFMKVFESPERVFWGMVSNNLSTTSVSRETSQPTCLSINAQMTNIIQLNFQRELVLHCLTGVVNGNARLAIESIGTRQADYQRYTNINTGDKAKDAKYASVYNLWLKNNGAQNGQPRLYSLLLTEPIIFANLNRPENAQVLKLLKVAYIPDLAKTKSHYENGRKIYTYSVTLSLRKYAYAQKDYAVKLGLPNATTIRPNGYTPNAKANITFTVDALSRQLRKISYGSVNETFSGYDLHLNVKPPTNTVSNQVLQNAFKNASQ